MDTSRLMLTSGFTKITGENGWIYTAPSFAVVVYVEGKEKYSVGISGDSIQGDISFEQVVERDKVIDTARLIATKYVACVREQTNATIIQTAAFIQNLGGRDETKSV